MFVVIFRVLWGVVWNFNKNPKSNLKHISNDMSMQGEYVIHILYGKISFSLQDEYVISESWKFFWWILRIWKSNKKKDSVDFQPCFFLCTEPEFKTGSSVTARRTWSFSNEIASFEDKGRIAGIYADNTCAYVYIHAIKFTRNLYF